MKRRVVVTGLGLTTPLGVDVSTSWIRLLQEHSGIVALKTSNVSSKVAAIVPSGPGYDNKTSSLTKSQEKQLPRFMRFAMDTSHQALLDAQWMPSDFHQRSRTGVCMGSGIGSTEEIANAAAVLDKEGPRKVSPYFIPRLLVNLAAGHISIKYGFHGPNHCASTACTTGAHAIGDAARFIAYGDADVMVAGGSESCITPLALAGFSQLRALSSKFNDIPATASRPFDRDRDGFVIGEGSGSVVLEELEHAKARGAKIYAELTGYGLSGDANHITSPPESGIGAVLAMKAALRNANNLDASQVDYVNAHATSTPVGDLIETRAIKQVFGSDVAVSSTKGAIGHLLGAAGSVEAIFTILSVNYDILPANLNLENLSSEEEYSLDYVRKTRNLATVARRCGDGMGVRAAMTNSFGFGGTNAALLFEKLRV